MVFACSQSPIPIWWNTTVCWGLSSPQYLRSPPLTITLEEGQQTWRCHTDHRVPILLDPQGGFGRGCCSRAYGPFTRRWRGCSYTQGISSLVDFSCLPQEYALFGFWLQLVVGDLIRVTAGAHKGTSSVVLDLLVEEGYIQIIPHGGENDQNVSWFHFLINSLLI